MTIHVPPWYLAMMLPALCFYAYTWKRMLPGITMTGVTQRGVAAALLGVAIGGIQSAICWPFYFGGTIISHFAVKLDDRDEDEP